MRLEKNAKGSNLFIIMVLFLAKQNFNCQTRIIGKHLVLSIQLILQFIYIRDWFADT